MSVMRPLAVVGPLLLLLGCGSSPKPDPRPTPARLVPSDAAAASARALPPPPEERRCAEAPRRPADNLSAVIEDADGELTGALARPPADAAGQWGEVLQRLSKDCSDTEVEHALPSTRVVLRAPHDCRAGAPKNELFFDFVPDGNGAAVNASGTLRMQGRALRVEARVTAAPVGKALCAAGRVDVGAPNAAARTESPAQAGKPGAVVERPLWLVVSFQWVAAVLGILPFRR